MVTSTVPAVSGGAMAVIVEPSTTLTTVEGEDPKNTIAPFAKPVPVMVTWAPPAMEPVASERPVTVGTQEIVSPLKAKS
jgi:hypothetical protein